MPTYSDDDEDSCGTPLKVAIETENEKWTTYLLEAGADVNNAHEFFTLPTALSAAIITGNLELFDLLLEKGAHLHEELFSVMLDDEFVSEVVLEKIVPFLPRLFDEVIASKVEKDTLGSVFEAALDYQHL
ncbi:hypothetical protein B0J14DRAFT_655874 [Halenospora varia]|nr:hypothetical protein B0J14DRAFT_655874 [Halenospora varia]